MSYESEQMKFNAELDFLKVQVEKLDMYFSKNPNAKIRRYNYYGISTETFSDRWQREKILKDKYHDYKTDYSLEYLDYKILKYRKAELEYKINQTKGQRTLDKALDYVDSITPQHVSGRVYQVKNGDGCGVFCLWFMIIDAIFVLILGCCMNGCH